MVCERRPPPPLRRSPAHRAWLLESRPGRWSSEDDLQARIFEALASHGFEREIAFGSAGKIDLFCAGTGVGVEVKIDGPPATILRQLFRYSGVAAVSGLVLATTKPVRLPETLNGKPVAMAALWKWGVL